MDVLSKSQRSYCMSQIRAKNTTPEILLRHSLWMQGLRYRLHYNLPGNPDIVFVRARVVVFIDGCFWHGCPIHFIRPKTNTSFWRKKLQGNRERDKRNSKDLENKGWVVLRFWEHEVKNHPELVLRKVKKAISTYTKTNGFTKKTTT